PTVPRDRRQAARGVPVVFPGGNGEGLPGVEVDPFPARAGREDVFAVISLQKERVNLGLANGAGLPDPEGLLEGTGQGIRHVKLTSPEAAGAPAVRQLVQGALTATKNGA